MSGKHRISRRTLLKGLGTAIALPMLEAMSPLEALGGSPSGPRRLAFFYVPNGIHMEAWTPNSLGADFTTPSILEPLAPLRKDLLVLSGLTLDKARALGDGGGDHARAMSTFLTGRHPRKTHGADLRAGVTADQVAAQKVGGLTRFPSLELGCDRGMQSGSCDSGYSCAYSANISWQSDSTPMAKEIDPGLLFDRLFSNEFKDEPRESRLRRQLYEKSILDFVIEDAGHLRAQLGAHDRRKIDEYLTSIRELERRIERADRDAVASPALAKPPAGIPKNYEEHIRLLMDLLVVAFQGDLTRIATFVFANEGSNRNYRFIGVPEGHHELSHHAGKKDKQDKIRVINSFHVSQFAYFLGKLKSIKEGNGTLLDQAMIVYGSGIGDGNRHNHDELPILVAGRGGGTIHSGRHLRFPKETPLTNLHLSLLDRMGAPTPSFGDSTGRLLGWS
jgi:Protein of unknown function (DUF1552)